MAPYSKSPTYVAHPIYESDGMCTGWFRYVDQYLNPEVLYGSWPPTTTLKFGGRTLEADRAVSVKITLLQPVEHDFFWTSRQQHAERVNLGLYHRDFSDIEVAYSISFPQTHVLFAGYTIHFNCFESLSVSSYNATARIQPEQVLSQSKSNSIDFVPVPMPPASSPTDSTEQSWFLQPCYYSVHVPDLNQNQRLDSYVATPRFVNDCECVIHVHDEYNIEVNVAKRASPVSIPPVFPLPAPFATPTAVFHKSSSNRIRALPPGPSPMLSFIPSQPQLQAPSSQNVDQRNPDGFVSNPSNQNNYLAPQKTALLSLESNVTKMGEAAATPAASGVRILAASPLNTNNELGKLIVRRSNAPFLTRPRMTP